MKTGIRYTPGDCALLIGPYAGLEKRLEAVRLAGLRPVLLCDDLPEPPPRGVRALGGQVAGVTGWMGAFRVQIVGPGGGVDLAPLSLHEDGHFDWVLDFSGVRPPGNGVAPLGHYALAQDDFPGFKRALLEIVPRLREGHEKPRYFEFHTELCAHRRQGVDGCSACLPACAAAAIFSDGETVRIEPHLCQGCGACALVCPTGAVRHRLPGTPARWTDLAADFAAGLWIGPGAPDGWQGLDLPEPASLGLEFWLAALALGAGRVTVAAADAPAPSRAALASQIDLGRALLSGLGLPLALGWAGNVLEPMPKPAAFTPPATDDKRLWLWAALDHLAGQAADRPEILPLPAGPLGEVVIDAARCTLCGACARNCPSQALRTSGPNQLTFKEADCSQCGLCRSVCPEQAVQLVPRYSRRPERQAPRLLVELEMQACGDCGSAFTSRAMFERARNLMAGHPMFQGEQASLLALCPDCRQKRMVMGRDAG